MDDVPRTTEQLRDDTFGRLRALRSRHGTVVFLHLVGEVVAVDVADEAAADRLSSEIRRLAATLTPEPE